MSEIKRHRGLEIRDGGDYVSYDDHLSALAQARAEERERADSLAIAAYQAGCARGHNDTVEGCYNLACEGDNECAREWLNEFRALSDDE